MTNDELKQAAERITGESQGAEYWRSDAGEYTLEEDARLLARHYLAQLAEDADGDVTIDKEWAEENGMAWTDDIWCDGKPEWEATLTIDPDHVIRFRETETMLCHAGTYWPHVGHCTTRRAVRQLLAALQIPTTKGPTNE